MNYAQRIVLAVFAPLALYAAGSAVFDWREIGNSTEDAALWGLYFFAVAFFEAWLWRDRERPFLLSAATWRRVRWVGIAAAAIAAGIGLATAYAEHRRQVAQQAWWAAKTPDERRQWYRDYVKKQQGTPGQAAQPSDTERPGAGRGGQGGDARRAQANGG